jgi:Fur family peroxide stress response transcriptional regulator
METTTIHSTEAREQAANHRIAELSRRLAEAGHRSTPQRMAIVEALLRGDHPSAESIFVRVHAQFPMTSLATVYKTLHTLQELGEVRELAVRSGRSHFDAMPPISHSHVICSSCGKIEDIDFAGMGALMGRVAAQSGFDIREQGVELYGLCPACRQ